MAASPEPALRARVSTRETAESDGTEAAPIRCEDAGMKKYLFIMANEGHKWGGSEPLWAGAAEKVARRGNEVRGSVKDWRGHVRSAANGVDLIVISQGSNDDGLLLIEAARLTGRRYAIVSQSAVVYWWPSDDFAERLKKVYEDASAAYFVSQSNLELSQRQ